MNHIRKLNPVIVHNIILTPILALEFGVDYILRWLHGTQVHHTGEECDAIISP